MRINDNFLCTYDALDVLVLPVDLLDSEDVVAKVQTLEATLLAQQGDHHASGPVQTLAKELPNE